MSRRLLNLRDAFRMLHAVVVCRLARLSSSQAGAVVVYHRVGARNGGTPGLEILAALSQRAFERQLRHIRRHYHVVPAAGLLEAVLMRRRGQPFPVAITFDDDLACHMQAAVPTLQRLGVPATFFLGGSSLDKPQPFWWEDLQRAVDDGLIQADSLPHVPESELRTALERRPKAILRVAAAIESLGPTERREVAAALREAVGPRLLEVGLRTDEVHALARAGFDVGFHTLGHDSLPTLSDAELNEALQDGRDALSDVIGTRIDTISYPHGKADARVATAARTAGFTLGFTTARKAVTPDTDPLLIPRIPPAPASGKTALRLARAVRARKSL
jgi:peptidoglycan/xylan/chitin deacetylase (PgdA/CDA1 family)